MPRLVAAAVFALLTIFWTLPALAHASLVNANPVDGAVLAEAPTELVLTFNEPVNPLAVLLVGPDGATSPLDAVFAAGNALKIELPTTQAPGTHVISWRAVSADGHPIAGTTSFSMGIGDAKVAAADVAPLHSEVAGLLWATRIILYIGLLFGAGSAGFRALPPVLPEPARRLGTFATVAGMGAAFLVIGLQGLDILGLGFGDLLQARVWGAGIASIYGQTSLLSLGAMAVGLIGFSAKSETLGRSMGIVAILLVGLAVSLSGHASSAQPQWLMKPALFFHMVAITWWVGALYPLFLLLRADPVVATPPLLKFSRAIPFAIVPLVASGLVLAVVQLGWPSPAWLSGYGIILAAKLVLLAALFAVAGWNRWVLTSPAAAGDAGAIRRMRGAIIGEMLLVLAIICLVSGWRFTPPPRSLAQAQPAAVELNLAKGDLVAAIRIAPAKVGPVDFIVDLSTAAGDPVSAKAVRLALTPRDGALAPTTRSAETSDVGRWNVTGVPLLLPGLWSVEVEVRVSDFDLVKLTGEIEVTP